MADGAHDKVKLNVRVPPAKKAEWKNELDEGETLSSLVRRAVDKEVRDQYISSDIVENIEGSGKSQDLDFTEITNRLESLEGLIESLQRQIDFQATDDAEEVSEEQAASKAMEVIEYIPTYADVHPDIARHYDGISDFEEYKDAVKNTAKHEPEKMPKGTVTDIAKEMREDDDNLIWRTLVYIERRTTEPVDSFTIQGIRHWVRKDR